MLYVENLLALKRDYQEIILSNMKYYMEIVSATFMFIYVRRWNDWKVSP